MYVLVVIAATGFLIFCLCVHRPHFFSFSAGRATPLHSKTYLITSTIHSIHTQQTSTARIQFLNPISKPLKSNPPTRASAAAAATSTAPSLLLLQPFIDSPVQCPRSQAGALWTKGTLR